MPKAEGMENRLAMEWAPEQKTKDGIQAAAVWYDDGDMCAQVYGNLGLDIDGDAMAELFAHAMQDVKTLLKDAKRYAWLKKHNLNGIQLSPDEAFLSICSRSDEIFEFIDICDLDKTIDILIERSEKLRR